MNESQKLTILLFLSLLAGLLSLDNVEGNGYVFSLMPKEHLITPLNQTYRTNYVTAEATIELSPKIYTWSDENVMSFLIDRNSSIMNNPKYRVFSVAATYEGNTSDGWFIFRGKTIISNLSDGEHLLEITFSPAGLGTIDEYKSKAVFRVETENSIPELSVIIILPLLFSAFIIVYRRHKNRNIQIG